MAGWQDAPIVEGDWRSAPEIESKPPQSASHSALRGLGLGTRDVIEGATALPGMALDAATWPARALIRQFGGTVTAPSGLIRTGVDATGLPQPETPTEKAISGIVQPVAGTLTGVGAGRALSTAAAPTVRAVGDALSAQPVTQAVAAGAGGAVGEATGDPNLGLATSVLVPVAGAGIGAGARAIEQAALGSRISEADAALGRIAQQKYGIPINATDLTDNSIIRIGADQAGKLPFSGAVGAAVAKQRAWQGAIAREMGESDATAFQPHVMTRAATRIGQTFDDVAGRTHMPPEQTAWLTDELDALSQRADKILLQGEATPIRNQINELKSLVAKNDGTLTGEQYQRLTRSNSDLSLLEKRNDNVGDFAGLMRDAIDDAFARSASVADQDALRQARYQYRVMRTVDQLAAGSRGGDISPDAFMQKVLTASRRFDPPTAGMAYTGGGEIGELARIGKLMRAAPQTGTADRLTINAGVGAGLAGGYLTPESALLTAGALGANRLAGNYLRSGATAQRLIDNTIGAEGVPVNALLRAMRTGNVAALENVAHRNALLEP